MPSGEPERLEFKFLPFVEDEKIWKKAYFGNFSYEYFDKVPYKEPYSVYSEEYIREHQDTIDWYLVSYYSIISEQFIFEFRDKLNMNYLLKNNKITKERLEELEYENIVHSRLEILDI